MKPKVKKHDQGTQIQVEKPLMPGGNQVQLYQDTQQPQQLVPLMRVDRGILHSLQTGYKHDIKPGEQLTIFDELEIKTQTKIRNLKVDKDELYLGIDLEGDGWEIIEVLQRLQYEHSNTTDQTRIDYYLGDVNTTALQTMDWGEDEEKVVYLETSLGELTRIRTDISKPAGSDLDTTKEMLMKYSDQRYLLKWKQYYTETLKNGKTRNGSRENIRYTKLYRAEVTTDKKARTSLVKIWLCPAFYTQIATHYDLKPINFLPRVKAAYRDITGNKRVKALPDYLLAFLNQLMDAQLYEEHTYQCKLMGTAREKGLYDKINYSWVKNRKWKKLEETLEIYTKIATQIGLLKRAWQTTSESTGDIIQHFEVVPQGEWK